MLWLLARCQQAVWAYDEWRGFDGPIPSPVDAFFAVLSLAYGPVLR